MNSQNDKPIRYLSVEDLYNINFTVTEGDTFVRDIHLLESAVNRPKLVLFGQPQFPTLLDKAAALMHSLAYHHLFADGNKRTAVFAVTDFLQLNGYTPTWDEDVAEAFVLEVAQHRHDIEHIAQWLDGQIRPIDG
jgi:death-on-curing protein